MDTALDRYKFYRNTNEVLILIVKFYKPSHYKINNMYDLFV